MLRGKQIADTFKNFLTPAYLNIVFEVSSARISSAWHKKSRTFSFVLSSNRIRMLQKSTVVCYRMPTLCGSIQNAKVKLYIGLANKRAATARDLRSKTRRFRFLLIRGRESGLSRVIVIAHAILQRDRS